MFKSFPPPLGGRGRRGTVGDKTAMFQLSLRYVPPRSILCRYQPPSPCREILFLHRFEQEEAVVVGRWSRRKRQACGPRETSCSLLFCDKTRLEGTTVHRAAAAAAAFKPTTHHRPADKSRISALRSLHWPGHHRDENYDHSPGLFPI